MSKFFGISHKMRTVTSTILVTLFMQFALYKVDVAVKMTWTNLTHKAFDPTVARILYCRLKPFKKDMKIISIRVRLMGAPLKNISGEIILQNMPVDLSKLNKIPLPLPIGDYAVYFNYKTFGVARILLNLYTKIEQA